jgi:hypothetical protein
LKHIKDFEEFEVIQDSGLSNASRFNVQDFRINSRLKTFWTF